MSIIRHEVAGPAAAGTGTITQQLSITPALARRLLSLALVLAITCSFMTLTHASATAQTPPPPSPVPSASTAPDANDAPSGVEPATSETPPAALSSFINPGLLESLQQAIVGLVTVWEEPENPLAVFKPVEPAADTSPIPVMSICTGWFDSPTTIVTAGHCVDPKEGRLAMDLQTPAIDPATGQPLPVDPVRPEPKRTVYAFQPRELPGAVITAPTIVRVHSFRPATEGDTAKLEIFGLPPAKPLAIAPDAPRLGEPVTSIGFPGLNIAATDGVDIKALFSGGKTPAEVLQDSRIQPVSTSGTITSRQFRDGVGVYQTNADLAAGTSGGPTVNARGQVYGINSQMTISLFGQNFNVITDTAMLREFLGHQNTQRQAAPTNTSIRAANERNSAPDGALPAGWIILITLFGGAILGGGISWLRSHCNTRSNRHEERDSQTPDQSRPTPRRHRASARDKPGIFDASGELITTWNRASATCRPGSAWVVAPLATGPALPIPDGIGTAQWRRPCGVTAPLAARGDLVARRAGTGRRARSRAVARAGGGPPGRPSPARAPGFDG